MKNFSHHKKTSRPDLKTSRPQALQTISLTIEALSPQGCGVSHRDDKKFIVPFTLPGETVRVLPITQKKNTVFCELVKVIKKSPKRTPPKCPHFGTCGGCDLQHMSYEDQLAFKQGKIESFFLDGRQTTDDERLVSPIIPSPLPFNYRNRITLHTDGKRTGYYKPFSHEIVAIETCALLADDGISSCAKASADRRTTEYGRRNTDDSPHSFTQVNSSQNQNLIQTVLNFCSRQKWKSVLELYCGNGNITFDLAEHCTKILAADLDAEAIRLANIQRHESKKTNIKFISSSAQDVVFQQLQALTTFDLIVCDPPREGLRDIAKLLPRLKPKQIVYVSCDPQTFLNDVKTLEGSGYTLTDVTPIDMFPQTYHVEVVGRLIDHP